MFKLNPPTYKATPIQIDAAIQRRAKARRTAIALQGLRGGQQEHRGVRSLPRRAEEAMTTNAADPPG